MFEGLLAASVMRNLEHSRATAKTVFCMMVVRYFVIVSGCWCGVAFFITKASMLAEFFFALAIGSGMSCVP